MSYEPRDRKVSIRARSSERESWREAADVAGFEGLSGWLRAVANLAARQTMEGALDRVPSSELKNLE